MLKLLLLPLALLLSAFLFFTDDTKNTSEQALQENSHETRGWVSENLGQQIKANKFPIGNSSKGDTNKFTNHELQLEKGDTIYVFSDGYCDQFGGPTGKKFKASALRQLLLSNQHLSMAEQRVLLHATIESWRGNHEQVDDILIIGTRYA